MSDFYDCSKCVYRIGDHCASWDCKYETLEEHDKRVFDDGYKTGFGNGYLTGRSDKESSLKSKFKLMTDERIAEIIKDSQEMVLNLLRGVDAQAEVVVRKILKELKNEKSNT